MGSLTQAAWGHSDIEDVAGHEDVADFESQKSDIYATADIFNGRLAGFLDRRQPRLSQTLEVAYVPVTSRIFS